MARQRNSNSDFSQDAFENLPEPACLIRTADLSIAGWNVRAEALLGPALKSQILFSSLFQPWNPTVFQEALVQRQFDSPELRGITAFTSEGKAVQFDLLLSEFQAKPNNILIAVFADATDRICLEEQLRQAQKMEAVGMLAGGIAHDFNNLLTIISGYSHMLASSLARDERNHFAAEQIIKASDRAAALTKQLLSFSRRQVSQSKVLDLTAVVQGMVPMLNRIIGEHIRLSIQPGADLGRVHGDPSQIEQIVMNLVVNARDAMPNGGVLSIETSNVEFQSEHVNHHMHARPGNYVLLSVSDSGIGMDAATREHIFEPFFTTKAEGQGTGLGLSMVYGIAQRSGGTIDVMSEPGRGTSVRVYLPRIAGSEPVSKSESVPHSARGTETVLLVEDEDAVRNIVKTALESQGYRLLVAASGEEAMNMAKAYKEPIGLLITDIVLPELNGKEIARRIHKKRPGMIVLFMSGYTDVSLNQLDDPQTRIHFIAKPFTPATLNRKVRELLDSGNQHGVPGH